MKRLASLVIALALIALAGGSAQASTADRARHGRYLLEHVIAVAPHPARAYLHLTRWNRDDIKIAERTPNISASQVQYRHPKPSASVNDTVIYCQPGETGVVYEDRVNGNDIIFITYWEWHLRLSACFNGAGIITKASYQAFPVIDMLGWWWDVYPLEDPTQALTVEPGSGVGNYYLQVTARAKFQFCPPAFKGQELGCIQTKYPWLTMGITASSRSYSWGGN